MSLASVISYGDGFMQGQEDMKNRELESFPEIIFSINEAETKIEKEKVEAFWMGYDDGAEAFLEGIML